MLPTGVSYSDHFGVEAVYALPSDLSRLPAPVQQLTTSELSTVKEALQRYRIFAAQESKHFLLYCGLALFMGLFVFPVASSFQPLGVLNWLFVWLGAISGAAAATMLYVGFLSGRKFVCLLDALMKLTRGVGVEQGVLANFIQEFEDRIVDRRLPAA